MGYRSDVAYTIRFVHDDDTNNKQSFYTFLAEAKANAATAACFSEEERQWSEFEVDEAKFRINFHADDVKWYESYADVQCHEALLSLAKEWDEDEDNHSEIAYMFIRVGEQMDDIEEKCGGDYDWDWVKVHRSISRDW
jgi:hypothetical protein